MPSEADRLHEGLQSSFADFFRAIDSARLEQRAGYRLVVCPSMPFPGLNGLWLDGPDASVPAREIEAAIAEAEAEAVPCWIESRAGRTPIFDGVARGLGFKTEEAMPGMVARRDDLVVAPSLELTVVRVRDPDRLAAAAAVAAAGFEAPPGVLAGLYTPDIAAIPGVSIYLGEVDGLPVSTATAWQGDSGVGIFNVATPPESRGRGYGRAITARAVLDGFASGAELAWLQASPLGDPVYRSMGFRQVDTYVLGRPPIGSREGR
jgi:N-acetylglutamate synthase